MKCQIIAPNPVFGEFFLQLIAAIVVSHSSYILG